MSLFPSEEHARRWAQANGYEIGAILPLARVWKLAKAWYTDPRRSEWRSRTRDESQAVLTSVGLIGAFWELPR
jgi:hypothetical protein